MVVCTRAFIERNRIKQHALQSSVYFLSCECSLCDEPLYRIPTLITQLDGWTPSAATERPNGSARLSTIRVE